jgi:hypothetical protein
MKRRPKRFTDKTEIITGVVIGTPELIEYHNSNKKAYFEVCCDSKEIIRCVYWADFKAKSGETLLIKGIRSNSVFIAKSILKGYGA